MLTAKFKKNGPFVTEMVNRKNSFRKANVLSVRAVVPFSLRWWYWLEYGTATRALAGHQTSAYEITPFQAPRLKWYDYEGKYRGDGKPGWVSRDFVLHPGIYPRRFVFHASEHIAQECFNKLTKFFTSGASIRTSSLQSYMLSTFPDSMRYWMVNMLISSPEPVPTGWQGTTFNIKFGRANDPWNAKLHGQLAADVFNANLSFKDTSR